MNLPNILSLFRIVLVPVFLICFFAGGPEWRMISAFVFILAVFTDFLDGRIARRYNQITMLGRFLDPLADKMMLYSVLISLTLAEIIPTGAAAVFFGVQVLQLLGGVVLFRFIKDVPPSNLVGKLTAVVFYCSLAVFLLFPDISIGTKNLPLSVAIVLMLLAFATYTVGGIKLMKARKTSKENKK